MLTTKKDFREQMMKDLTYQTMISLNRFYDMATMRANIYERKVLLATDGTAMPDIYPIDRVGYETYKEWEEKLLLFTRNGAYPHVFMYIIDFHPGSDSTDYYYVCRETSGEVKAFGHVPDEYFKFYKRNCTFFSDLIKDNMYYPTACMLMQKAQKEFKL